MAGSRGDATQKINSYRGYSSSNDVRSVSSRKLSRPQTGRTMLTGGTAVRRLMRFDGAAALGRHRQAAMIMLAMWSTKAVLQNDAAATAKSVMDACHRCFE